MSIKSNESSLKNFKFRKMTELERARRMGNAGGEKVPKKIGEHPIVMVNSKTNALLMSKREKLMTVRQKKCIGTDKARQTMGTR